MDEATKLLSAACDTFIKTLEECMKLSSANIIYELPQHSNDVMLPPVPANSNAVPKKVKFSIFVTLFYATFFLLQNNKNLSRLNSTDT